MGHVYRLAHVQYKTEPFETLFKTELTLSFFLKIYNVQLRVLYERNLQVSCFNCGGGHCENAFKPE